MGQRAENRNVNTRCMPRVLVSAVGISVIGRLDPCKECVNAVYQTLKHNAFGHCSFARHMLKRVLSSYKLAEISVNRKKNFFAWSHTVKRRSGFGSAHLLVA